MTNKTKSIIAIQKGSEYHVLVDDPKNIYNKSLFFYPHIYGGILYKDLVEWFESYGGWGGDR